MNETVINILESCVRGLQIGIKDAEHEVCQSAERLERARNHLYDLQGQLSDIEAVLEEQKQKDIAA